MATRPVINFPSSDEVANACELAREYIQEHLKEFGNVAPARHHTMKRLRQQFDWMEYVASYREASGSGPLDGPASQIRTVINDAVNDWQEEKQAEKKEVTIADEDTFFRPGPHPTVAIESVAAEYDEIPPARLLSLISGYEEQRWRDAITSLRGEGWVIDLIGYGKGWTVISRPEHEEDAVVDLTKVSPEQRKQVLAILNGK